MDKADKLVNNREPKRLIAFFVLIVLASAVVGFIVSERIADRIVGEQITAMLDTAGGVGKDDFRFTDTDGKYAAEGEEMFTKYGISADMDPQLMNNRDRVRNTVFAAIFGTSLLLSLLWLILSLRQVGGIYDTVEKIRQNCINITWNSDSDTFITEDTGCIGSLSYAVSLMSRQYTFLADKAERERTALADFLTDFSHQIKTSLSVVRLNTDIMLGMDKLSAERRDELADEIERNTDSMESLVKSALRLARLNSGAVEYKMEELPLNNTCASAIRRLSPLLRDRSISVELIELSGEIVMKHDRLWLCEAVENLIKNCADHSECTEINVTLERTPTAVTVSVSDNGKGIPQSDIPHIFERFGRPRNDITMNSVGIGMSVAQKITEAHNGEIIVYSEVGHGTRFDMVFIK